MELGELFPPTPPKKQRWSAAELLKEVFPAPTWIIPGFIPSGLTILAARPKQGKSILALQLLVAVSLPHGSLFDLPLKQHKSILLAYEDSPYRIQERAKNLGMCAESTLEFDFSRLGLNHGGFLLVENALENGISLVVIDTFSRAAGGLDQMDLSQMTDTLGRLQELGLEYNAAILLIDHTRKPNGMLHDPIDDIFGTSGKSAVADSVITLTRRSGISETTLSARGRDFEEKTMILGRNDNGFWHSLGSKTEFTASLRSKEIITYLTDNDYATLKEITGAMKQDKGNTSRRLHDLIDSGLITKTIYNNKICYERSKG